MRMKWKFAGIATAMIVVAALCAFGGASQEGQGSTAASEGGNMNLTGLPIVKEKVSLDIVARKRAIHGEFEEMPFFITLEEKTNVHINWETVPESQYNERKNLILASGDLPDAFFGQSSLVKNDLVIYGPQGLFVPMEDLIDKYAPNILDAFARNPDFRKICTTPDGHIYSVGRAAVNPPHYGRDNFFMYKPWLDKLGFDVPDTTDEFYAVLKAFKEQDPNGNNMADEIPFSFLYNHNFRGMGSLYGAFGRVDDNGHLFVEDDKVIFAPMEPEFREAVAYYHTYFEAGLFDEECFTQDNRQYSAKGRTETPILGSFISWNDFDIAGEERASDYVVVPPLEGPNGDKAWRLYLANNGNIATTGFTITSACDQVEIAVRWVDQFYDRTTSMEAFYGPIGTYLGDNGDGTYSFLDVPEGLTKDEWQFSVTPVDSPCAIFDGDLDGILPVEPVSQKKRDDIANYYQQYMTSKTVPGLMYTTEEAKQLSVLSTDIFKYVNETQAQWLLNGGIEEEWNGYLDRLSKMRIDEYLSIVQAAYDRFIGAE